MSTQNDIKYDHVLFDQGECSSEMDSTAATWEAAAPLSSDLFEAQGVVDKHEAGHGGHDGRYGHDDHDNHDGQSSIGLCLVILVIEQVLLHPLPIHMKAKMVTCF